MGAPITTTTTSRLKREDFRHTKHDTAFTKWQLLIGPRDWADYEAHIEGAERYRVANLPPVCGPGLYEIGVAVNNSDLGRKLEPDRIVVVYLGQADNVRSRLQEYGRSGSHLVQRRRCWVDNADESMMEIGCHQGTGLFKEIFSRGYPIVYRWAPMKSKSDAERMEAKLLERFDYPWNKVGNGTRRPDDVLMKIEKISTRSYNVPKILKMLQALREQKVGIPIKAAKTSLSDTHDTSEESLNLFGRVLKFGRSRPRLVSANPSMVVKESNQTHVCGVTLVDGSICYKPPVEGRKRCILHKGRRITNNLIVVPRPSQAFSQDVFLSDSAINVVNEEFSPICGVTLHDGSPCARPPFPGRKRCTEHKGMRVNQTVSKYPDAKPDIDVSLSNLSLGDYCGLDLADGHCCMRQPVKGRKRCEEHKGMRVDSYIKKQMRNQDSRFKGKPLEGGN